MMLTGIGASRTGQASTPGRHPPAGGDTIVERAGGAVTSDADFSENHASSIRPRAAPGVARGADRRVDTGLFTRERRRAPDRESEPIVVSSPVVV
jgi:hypothetical protein